MAEREYAEIEQYDVGRSTFHAFGRAWSVADFIGAITDADVGKRVYRTSKHVVSVENAEQFKARLATKGQVPNNAAWLANLVYKALNLHRAEFGAPDLVRPPNPAHGHAVAVLFADGRDVVIRFEEQGGK